MTPAPAPAKHPARFTVEQFHRLCEAVPEQRLALQLRVEAPLDLGPANEPEPDLALVARRADDYWHAHPTAADTALVIEVADTSLAFDLEAKARLYAGAGIPGYWVVDVLAPRLQVVREPGNASDGSCLVDLRASVQRLLLDLPRS